MSVACEHPAREHSATEIPNDVLVPGSQLPPQTTGRAARMPPDRWSHTSVNTQR
jgi:hypothetical protein